MGRDRGLRAAALLLAGMLTVFAAACGGGQKAGAAGGEPSGSTPRDIEQEEQGAESRASGTEAAAELTAEELLQADFLLYNVDCASAEPAGFAEGQICGLYQSVSDQPFGTDAAQLQYVYQDGLLDGYRPESNGPRYYDNTVARAARYFIPNGIKDRTASIDMISPYYVEKMAETFLKKTKGYGFTGISVENLASDLFSDFNSRHYVERQTAAERNCGAMERLASGCGGALLGSNANVYAWQYLSDIKNVPLDSNRTQLIDEVIPFYGMVLHGYREYAGTPVNLSGDMNTMLLKSVESGAGLSFQLICGDNSLLKNTEFDSLYSVNFEAWKDTALAAWQKVNEAVGDLQGLLITGHEKLSDDVYCTIYEDGTRVIVNYGRQEVQYQGNTVGAQDFLVLKEG